MASEVTLDVDTSVRPGLLVYAFQQYVKRPATDHVRSARRRSAPPPHANRAASRATTPSSSPVFGSVGPLGAAAGAPAAGSPAPLDGEPPPSPPLVAPATTTVPCMFG